MATSAKKKKDYQSEEVRKMYGRRDLLKGIALAGLGAGVAGLLSGMKISEAAVDTTKPAIVSQFSQIGDASVVVFQDSNGVNYAIDKGGVTGQVSKIIASGTGAASVIQQAINALTPGRTWKEKVIVKGNISLSSTITLPNYTILEIQGQLTGSPSYSGIQCGSHCEVKGGFLSNFNIGIDILSATDVIIRGVNIASCNLAMRIIGADTIWVEENNCQNNQYGIFLYDNGNASTPPLRVHVRRNKVSGNTGTQGSLAQAAGISLAGAQQCEVVSNIIINNATRGIYVVASAAPSIGNSVQGNLVISNGSSGGFAGIDIDASSAISALDNFSYKNYGPGIVLSDLKNSIIAGNRCVDNNQANLNPSIYPTDGISIGGTTAGTQFCSIKNNICYDDQPTKTQIFGIREYTGSNNINNVIEGNDLRGNQTALSISSFPNIIRNNLGYNPQGFNIATPAMPASGTAQSNTFPFPVIVYLYGGTVTQITINGQVVFSSGTGISLTGQSFTLNPGDTIAITYSAAPTWKWYGL